MTHSKEVKQRPEPPTEESRALVVQKLEPNSNTVFKRVSTERSSEIIIKGNLTVLKRRQSRVLETTHVLGDEWTDIQDELETLEAEVAA